MCCRAPRFDSIHKVDFFSVYLEDQADWFLDVAFLDDSTLDTDDDFEAEWLTVHRVYEGFRDSPGHFRGCECCADAVPKRVHHIKQLRRVVLDVEYSREKQGRTWRFRLHVMRIELAFHRRIELAFHQRWLGELGKFGVFELVNRRMCADCMHNFGIDASAEVTEWPHLGFRMGAFLDKN